MGYLGNWKLSLSSTLPKSSWVTVVSSTDMVQQVFIPLISRVLSLRLYMLPRNALLSMPFGM